ncbi:MAG: ATP-binding cassette domain-containing protein [Promethearchaeota archaeon]
MESDNFNDIFKLENIWKVFSNKIPLELSNIKSMIKKNKVAIGERNEKIKSRGYHEALKGINIRFEKGKFHGIVGPNGCGKTTLLRMLDFLITPTKGRIIYKNRDITNLKEAEKVKIRRSFAFIRQKPVVFDVAVRDFVSYGLKLRNVPKSEREKRVDDILSRVGLTKLKNNSALSLSGGEMQRLIIAANFILDAEVYFLDEFTANLDPYNIHLLDQIMEDIKKDHEKTVIFTTHDRNDLIKYADNVHIMMGGELIYSNSLHETFLTPKNDFLAKFMGYENILEGYATYDNKTKLTKIIINNIQIFSSHKAEGSVKICIRPESIILFKKKPEQSSALNIFYVKIKRIKNMIGFYHVSLDLNGITLIAAITERSLKSLNLQENQYIFINFKATDVILY